MIQKVLVCAFLLLTVHFCFSQSNLTETSLDYYQIEKEGFLINPVQTSYGLVFTNNHCDHLYLNNSSGLQTIANSRGCGRYFSVSPDGKYLGYKKIGDDGTQTPVVINLEDGSETILHVNSGLCGQISFSNTGALAYSSDEEILLFENGNIVKSFKTDGYVNMPVISPDGSKMAYNNQHDQLMILDVFTAKSTQISDNKNGYAFPKWSPNSKQILFQSFNGGIYVFNSKDNTTLFIANGASPNWLSDETIVFQQSLIENQQLISADIYSYHLSTKEIQELTTTPTVFEMNPSLNGNSIVYHTYNNKQIFEIQLDDSYNVINQPTLLFDGTTINALTPTQGQTYKNGGISSSSVLSTIYIPNVYWLHQMYDTPDWHSGSGSCGPTAAMMLIAYYNKLPKWENTVCCPYTHTSEYGYYVASKYMFNNFTFDIKAYDTNNNDAWGGLGYMWGQGSPHTMMAGYLNEHGLNADTAVDGDYYFVTLNELINGYPQVICNLLTSAGHIVIATGAIHPQRTIICNDPYGDKNTQIFPGYAGKDAHYDWPGYNNGYENFDGGYGSGGVAWTINVHGQEKTYDDKIIDDLDFNHGFYVGNSYPSDMDYFRDQTSGGYGDNNHFWWTYSISSTPSVCTVSWTPTLDSDGKYKVSVYIPSSDAEATNAKYIINHALGTTSVLIDQNTNQGKWVDLGDYYFYAGQSGNVLLGDSTGINYQKLAFDAMKWEPLIVTDLDNTETNNEFVISVSPNPATDRFKIYFNAVDATELPVKIYNPMGQMVWGNTIIISSASTSLDVVLDQELSDGVYKITVQHKDKLYTQNIVLNKK